MNVQWPSLDSNREAWALAASVASDGLWYYDGVDQQLRLAPRALELLGYSAHASPPSLDELRLHVSASEATTLERMLRELWRGERRNVDTEVQVTRDGKALRWVQLRARTTQSDEGTPRIVAGSLCDVDQRKCAELALRDGTRLDALTGLPNRAALAHRLTARIARATIATLPRFAVLYLDLDRFKEINDTYGHASGDLVLVETASRLLHVTRSTDTVTLPSRAKRCAAACASRHMPASAAASRCR